MPDRDKVLEQSRARAAKWYAENPGKAREKKRRQRQAGTASKSGKSSPERNRRRLHGLSIDEWIAATAAAQGGVCYLCGTPAQRLVIDHDHSCCLEGYSCPACRRGLACDRCNRLIGQVGDDPELLRRIADALEERIDPTRARIAAKPPQLTLDGEL